MAIVHTLPVPLEPARETATAPKTPAMGSVSSLISGRPCPVGPAPQRHHGVPGPTFFRQQDGLLPGGYEAQEPLCPAVPPRKAVPGNSFTYVNEDFRTESPPSPSSDVEDPREHQAHNAHLRGPPPKLIPVSGKLEKNMEKILIRPTAFKPVLPKPRGAPSLPGFLGPRAAGLSGSQGSLTQLFGGPASSSSSSSSSSAADKPLALSGWASELVALRVALREARATLRVSEGRARGLQEAARAREQELEACSQELQRYRQEAERLREKAGHLDAEASGLRDPPVPPATTDPFLLAESDEAKVQRAAAGAGGSLRAQVERLRQELQREQRRGDEQRDSFEGERLAWQAEKEQVIRYQKQLQHNYIQMYRRNRQLEQELQQLSLELEARELADLGLAESTLCVTVTQRLLPTLPFHSLTVATASPLQLGRERGCFPVSASTCLKPERARGQPAAPDVPALNMSTWRGRAGHGADPHVELCKPLLG